HNLHSIAPRFGGSMRSTLVSASVVIACLAGTPSALASSITYQALLSGPNESPATPSPGTGIAEVTIDDTLLSIRIEATFSGLLAPSTAAHIHCCTAVAGTGTAGVATAVPAFPGFPLGVTSGSYDQTFDLTMPLIYNPAFVTAQGSLTAA